MNVSGFIRELRRRHVFRIAAAYAVTAWLLLQLAAILFPAFNAPHWAIRVLVGVLVAGAPVALAIAWIYEVTPQGVRRTPAADSEEALPPELRQRTTRLLNATIIVVLAAAVGVLAWQLYLRPTSPGAGGSAAGIPANSIAVLPFTDLSPQANQGYFARGIAEQLLDILARATDLKVVARTSAFQFQGKAEDVRKIGKALDVRHVLEGSVLRDKNEVRISVQLVDARTGYQEWSHTYQREMGDIFQVQDAITRAIGDALQAKFGTGAAGSAATAVAKADPPANPEAYDEYLLGRHLMDERTHASLEKALAHFKKAMQLDPDYAPPYAQTAIVYMLLDVGDEGDYTWNEAVKLAKPYLDRATALAPNAPSTLAAKGRSIWYGPGSDARALPYFTRAVAGNPSDMGPVVWKAFALNRVGRRDEALEALRAGAERDPLNWMVNQDLVDFLMDRGKYDEAEAIARRFLGVDPGHGHVMMGMINDDRGHLAAAAGEFLAAVVANPEWQGPAQALSGILWQAGLAEESASLVRPPLIGERAAYAGHDAEAAKQVRVVLDRYSDQDGVHLGAGVVYLLIGKRKAARQEFDAALQRADNEGRDLWRCQCWEYGAAYVALLKQAGNTDQAQELIKRLRAGIVKQRADFQAKGKPPFGLFAFSMAQMDAVAGHPEAALTGLEKAMKLTGERDDWLHGELTPLVLERLPQFDALRGEPRFRAIIKQLKERQAKLRAQLLPVLCNRKYPSGSWHPQAATCAGIAKAPSVAST